MENPARFQDKKVHCYSYAMELNSLKAHMLSPTNSKTTYIFLNFV